MRRWSRVEAGHGAAEPRPGMSMSVAVFYAVPDRAPPRISVSALKRIMFAPKSGGADARSAERRPRRSSRSKADSCPWANPRRFGHAGTDRSAQGRRPRRRLAPLGGRYFHRLQSPWRADRDSAAHLRHGPPTRKTARPCRASTDSFYPSRRTRPVSQARGPRRPLAAPVRPHRAQGRRAT